jgi:malate dehydrogenase
VTSPILPSSAGRPAAVILGAGDIGAAIARRLAEGDRFGAITLVDEAAGVAAGKALDIQQTAPVRRFAARVVAASEDAAPRSAVVVVADAVGPPTAEHAGEAGLTLIRRASRSRPDAFFVCAGGAQTLLLERAVVELGVSRARIIGSAPIALEAALRAHTALAAGAAARDVHLSVIGAPRTGFLVCWGRATIRGAAAEDVLGPAAIARLSARVARLWPPGPYALADAAARVCEAFAGRETHALSCLAWLDGEYGVRRAAGTVPVTVGDPRGALVHDAPLNPREAAVMKGLSP